MDGMFNFLKSAAKSKGVELLDSHLRPVIQTQATSELTSLRSHSTTMLPDIMKKSILSYLEGTPGLSMVAALMTTHMDTFLASFVAGFQPMLVGATEHLDTHVTDKVMEKLKVKLHLSSLPQDTLTSVKEVIGVWPALPDAEGWSRSVHARVRDLSQGVVAQIVQQAPRVFQQHLQTSVLDRCDTSGQRGGMTSFVASLMNSHTSVFDGVTDQVWKHVQGPFTQGLVTLFTHFENGVMDTVKREVSKVPGLGF